MKNKILKYPIGLMLAVLISMGQSASASESLSYLGSQELLALAEPMVPLIGDGLRVMSVRVSHNQPLFLEVEEDRYKSGKLWFRELDIRVYAVDSSVFTETEGSDLFDDAVAADLPGLTSGATLIVYRSWEALAEREGVTLLARMTVEPERKRISSATCRLQPSLIMPVWEFYFPPFRNWKAKPGAAEFEKALIKKAKSVMYRFGDKSIGDMELTSEVRYSVEDRVWRVRFEQRMKSYLVDNCTGMVEFDKCFRVARYLSSLTSARLDRPANLTVEQARETAMQHVLSRHQLCTKESLMVTDAHFRKGQRNPIVVVEQRKDGSDYARVICRFDSNWSVYSNLGNVSYMGDRVEVDLTNGEVCEGRECDGEEEQVPRGRLP